MRFIFLIPLTLGLAVGAISQQLADEIAYLTGAFAVLNLLLSLILAPWQVQILLLIVAFFVVRYLWLRAEARSEADEVSASSNPKGSRQYRGVSYDDHSMSVDLDQGQKVVRQYRGVSYQDRVTAIPQQNPARQGQSFLLSRLAIKYRGANLMASPTSPSEPGSNAETPQA